MKDNSLKITVVTVCYNAVDTLEKTMLSVLNQTYPNVEYIVIDGGSTDGTVDIIKKYADRLAYWVSEPDKGIYDAMNKGITVATGDYINFMNAGDKFNDCNVLGNVILKISIENDIVYGETIYMTEFGEYVSKVLPIEKMSQCMPFGHQSTFVKTELMKERKFDISFKSSSDFHFLYNCYKDYKSFSYIPLIISKYDLTQGMSLDNYRIKIKEDGHILGWDKNPMWILKYNWRVLKMDMRRIIKKITPKCVLKCYKRNKLKRLNNTMTLQ